MIFDKVAAVLAEYKGCAKEEIALDSTFESLGIDSLDTVEIAMKLEEEFSIEISIDSPLHSVKDLVALIEKEQQ